VQAIEDHLNRVRSLEKTAEEWAKVNAIASHEYSAVEFHRLEAEHWLAMARTR
jgi:hypothetical protein